MHSQPTHRQRACLVAVALLATWMLPVSAARAQNQGLEGELRDLTWVGFQQFQEATRVFVRTSDPVQYKVDTTQDNVVVIILENTRIPIFNNTRLLDTRFFDSPILNIKPKIIEGPSPSVRIEIRMRHKVPFKESQHENVLALDFERR
jgi:colicin import membrane protein